jgi:hypothetical protein
MHLSRAHHGLPKGSPFILAAARADAQDQIGKHILWQEIGDSIMRTGARPNPDGAEFKKAGCQ